MSKEPPNRPWFCFSRMTHPGFSKTIVTFTRAKGAHLFDVKGRKFFDGFSTLWTNLVGHGRREIVDAIAKQSKKLSFMHLFGGSLHEPAVKLTERLLSLSPFDHKHCYFGLSGSDATDTAIKLARNYWYCNGKPKKNIIVARKSSYHGTTMGALSLMGHDSYRTPFAPLVDRVYRVGPNDIEEIAKLFDQVDAKENIAAVLIEPIITSDGHIISEQSYWDSLTRLCKENNVLIISDEVSTGMGRTGAFYGASLYGIRPDIVYLAKSLTSGYAPLAAVMTSDKIFNAIHTDNRFFMHGTTFGGHPLSCVAALEVLGILKRDRLIEKARGLANVMENAFDRDIRTLDCVKAVNGKGTLFEITIRGIHPERVVEFGYALYLELLSHGQYLRILGNGICIAPPLISKKSDVGDMIGSIRESLLKMMKKRKYWK